ncbi:hypothetical protein Ancab_038304 [Ancistrocladus abbreviatus]
MKAECLEGKDTNNTGDMFNKFHQPPPQFPHPPPSPPPLHHPNPQYHPHFNLGANDFQNSKEADSPAATTAAATTATPPAKKPKTAHEDGATIEVSKRPRGRPPGSKNKPKPPIVIAREQNLAMSPYILEVQSGADIVECLTRFTRLRNIGICVLTASGMVANVTLRQPSSAPHGGATFHGHFNILSLSAVLLGDGGGSWCGRNGLFTISFAGPQGQTMGGKVMGALLAAGGGDGHGNSPGISGGAGGSGDGDNGEGDCGGGGGREIAGSLSMYGCHLASDVLWAPTARPPPPPHHPY